MTALKYVMLLQRDVPAAVQFYSKGLGLHVRAATDRWAELGCEKHTILALKAVDGCGRRCAGKGLTRPYVAPEWCTLCREAFLTTGFSPFLTFAVPDLQQTLTQMLQLGAKMDGAIHYPASGPVSSSAACLYNSQAPAVFLSRYCMPSGGCCTSP